MLVSDDYWSSEHLASLERSLSFSDVGAVALAVALRMPQPLCQVCGPISTGGYGSLEKNLEAFEKTIYALRAEGNHVFNQMPMEDSLFRIREAQGKAYDWQELLIGAYAPVFSSGVIKKLYFIHGWESSRGTRWEHDQAEQLGIKRVYLPKGFGLVDL